MRLSLRRNTSYLLIGNGLSAVLSFGLTVIIARGWGDAGLGFYGTVLAWVYPLSLVAEMGIGTYLTRCIAQAPDSTGVLVRTAIRARLLMGTGLGVLLIGGAIWTDDNRLMWGLVIAIPLLIVNPLYSTFTAVMRGHERMRPIACLNVSMLVAQVALTGIAWMGGGSILDVLIINTATSAGQMGVAWWVYQAHYGRYSKVATESMGVVGMLRASGAFAVAGILSAVQTRGILLILHASGGEVAVGFYLASWRWLEAGRLLPMAFFDALYPRLSALATSTERLGGIFWRANLLLLGYGLLVASVLSVGASSLIGVVFGETFTASVGVLQVMAWGLVFLLLRQLWTLYAYALGREGYANWATCLVIVLQLGVAFVGVREIGIMGAVIAFIVGEIVLLGALYFVKASPPDARTLG